MDDVTALVADAFQQLDLDVSVERHAEHVDVVVDPGGVEVGLTTKRYSLVSDDLVRRILRGGVPRRAPDEERPDEAVLFLVADRVTAQARRLLLDAGCGYLDLRGHLGIKAPRLIISSDVDLGWVPQGRANPLTSKAGLEVATAILSEPQRGLPVRELARDLERSPSTVSDVLAALRRDRLIDERARLSDTRLFWEVVEVWPGKRQYLAEVPPRGARTSMTEPLRLGVDDVESSVGWGLTDLAAASVYGAPVAVRADQPLDFFVPDASVVRRARTLLGAATSPGSYGCSVRVAPVPAVCRRRIDSRPNYFEWPMVHPVFVALDLAQDSGRGQEVLSDWTPSAEWVRVW